MTRTELQDYVRDMTLIDATSLPDADLNAFFDQGYRDISTRFDWPWLDAEAALVTVGGTDSYAAPADMMHIVAITEDDAKVRLRELDGKVVWQRYGGDIPSGAPRAFFIWLDKIYPVPEPDTAKNYTVRYRKEPTVMATDGASPEWSELFHYVLGDWTIWKVWERQEVFGHAQNAERDFLIGLERMAQFYMNRADDEPIIFGESPDQLGSTAHGNMPWLDGV